MRKFAGPGLLLAVLLVCGCGRRIEVTGQPKDETVESPPYLSEEWWKGEPEMEGVPGTGITFVKEFGGKPLGSDYDICRVGKRWYWPYKGHWFYSRKSWRGPWKHARRVPVNFLRIPSNHPRYRVTKLHPDYRKP
jgi:hypothetical protein